MNKEIKEEGPLSYLLRTLKPEQIEAMKMCMEYECQQERERIIKEIEKQGVVIHKGELRKGIYGLLIDLEKIRFSINH